MSRPEFARSPYDAEAPVVLRTQTLRRVNEPEPEPDSSEFADDHLDEPEIDESAALPAPNVSESAKATRLAIAAGLRQPADRQPPPQNYIPADDQTQSPTIEFEAPIPSAPHAPPVPDASQYSAADQVRSPQNQAAPVDEAHRLQLRRAGLLAANPGIETDPAEWGWRGRVSQSLGLRLRPQPDEVDYRYDTELVSRAQLPPWFIVMVANPKGGQGKTPTTLVLAYIFAMFHGSKIVAWDNTESKGTLADRAEATTDGPQMHVWDLLEHATELAGPNAQAGALSTYLRRQPSTKVEVLASDSTSARDKAIGRTECEAVAAVLGRHRDGVFVDTAGEDLSDNWQWTAEHAHQLVIPMTYRRDAARAVLEMIDGLTNRHGRADLVSRAVVAIAATPGSADPLDREAIIADLHDLGISQIFEVPYEPLFEGSGTRIAEPQLSYPTHVAYTKVAAAIADNLSDLRANVPVAYTAGAVPQSISRPATYTRQPIPEPQVHYPRYSPAPYSPPPGYEQPPMNSPQWAPGPQGPHYPSGSPGGPQNQEPHHPQGGN